MPGKYVHLLPYITICFIKIISSDKVTMDICTSRFIAHITVHTQGKLHRKMCTCERMLTLPHGDIWFIIIFR